MRFCHKYALHEYASKWEFVLEWDIINNEYAYVKETRKYTSTWLLKDGFHISILNLSIDQW